jgi:hypothetical protein
LAEENNVLFMGQTGLNETANEKKPWRILSVVILPATQSYTWRCQVSAWQIEYWSPCYLVNDETLQ